MDIIKLIGKGNKTGLLDHSIMVYNVSMVVANTLNITDNEILGKIGMAALLHDIGKAYHKFQNYITNGVESDTNNILHHQISWCISAIIFNHRKWDAMLNAIYWHHPSIIDNKNSNTRGKIDAYTIFKELTNEDISVIVDILNHYHQEYPNLFKNNINISDITEPSLSISTPGFFYDNSGITNDKSLNEDILIHRAILISSDRIASNEQYDGLRILKNDVLYIQSLLTLEKDVIVVDEHPIYDNAPDGRFSKQVEIINDITNCTTILKAPTGFGKTILGLLWSLRSKKKLLWVCPRNVVVETVYQSINEELTNLNLVDKLSIELYLTGQRIACNKLAEKLDEFNSDIIITNIDNFLSPFHKNKVMSRMYSIFNYDVVFDEFHEFIDSSPIFSLFVEVMNIRHNTIKSNTLLLSATPHSINHLWDVVGHRTAILPNADTHFKAVHNKPYTITIDTHTSNDVKKFDGLTPNTLTIYNTIRNAQKHKKYNGSDLIVHSDFLPLDKIEILGEINQIYGKRGVGYKKSVVSAPIIQASMDISFQHLIESISSPEESMQRIGRCNRWGEYDDATLHLIYYINNMSEKTYVRAIKCTDEQSLWIKFLTDNISDTITLDQLYNLYNKFNIQYNEIRRNDIRSKLNNSYAILADKIFPTKWSGSGNAQGEAMLIKLSNNLRESKQGYFCIYKIHGTEEYIATPFSETVMISRGADLGEDDSTSGRIRRVVKDLTLRGKFKYNKYILGNKSSICENLFKCAQYNSEMPYIAFNKEYSREYGLAKNDIYNT